MCDQERTLTTTPDSLLKFEHTLELQNYKDSQNETVKVTIEEFAEEKGKQKSLQQTCMEQNSEIDKINQSVDEVNDEKPNVLTTKSRKKINTQKKIVTKSDNVGHQTIERSSGHIKARMTKDKADTQIKEFVSLVCDICQDNHQYLTFKDVQEHYQHKHQLRGYVTCCDKKFLRKDRLMNHITIHINPDAFK